MATCYRIRDWDSLFEVAQSKRAEKLSWVAIPNRHDGKGYRRLIRMPNGMAMYGAWNVIVQVASKCLVRGTLADHDGPYSAFEISDKTGVDAGLIEDALKACCTREIGWIEAVEWESAAPSVLRAYSDRSAPTEHNKTRQNKTEQNKEDFPALPEALAIGDVPRLWVDFIGHRHQLRKPVSALAAGRLISKLERMGPESAAIALENSIANGWQGVFEPQAASKHEQKPRPKIGSRR